MIFVYRIRVSICKQSDQIVKEVLGTEIKVC